MSLRLLRRAIASAAFVAVLGLCLPVAAHALPARTAPERSAVRLWDASFLEKILRALWDRNGSVIDPNGGTTNGDNGSGLDPNGGARTDNGSGIDPDGSR
jgi:hypothetical protein